VERKRKDFLFPRKEIGEAQVFPSLPTNFVYSHLGGNEGFYLPFPFGLFFFLFTSLNYNQTQPKGYLKFSYNIKGLSYILYYSFNMV
jgi:hypothetical protein